MRLGIDFGTTRVAVAAVDRGNYPVVVFDTPQDVARDWVPSLIAVQGPRRLYGWEAWSVQEEPTWTVIRSFKRALGSASLASEVEIAGQVIPLSQLLAGFCAALRLQLLKHSNLEAREGEALQAMLGVPANASSNQRFLTAEIFRRGGFEVLGILNEPSAASIEFGHSSRRESSPKPRTEVLVYDLGGGTFDASLVELHEGCHTVIASEGIETLGGDDFDESLAELAVEAAGLEPRDYDSLTQGEVFRLHEECREKKEALHPNTRVINIDLAKVRPRWRPVTVTAAGFYERCRPAVEETIHVVEDMLSKHGLKAASAEGKPRIDTFYITGGASDLPLVARMLRETFGRAVRRSGYTRFATAIGLAIQADSAAGYQLRDRFTRFFGVWREADAGHTAVFDPLFAKGTLLPAHKQPPIIRVRRYSPTHNIGHFRYFECSQLDDDGRPAGDINAWDEIRFPFDPALREACDLANAPVLPSTTAASQHIEETYSCDASGGVIARIANLSSGYEREYRLGRWHAPQAPLAPGRPRRARRR